MDREEMERVNEELKKKQQQTRTSNSFKQKDSPSIYPPDEEIKPEPWKCDVCGHTIEPLWNIWDKKWIVPMDDGCPKCAARERGQKILEQMQASLLQNYGMMDGQYAHMTMDSYQPDPTQPSQAAAKRAVFDLVRKWKAGDWSAGLMLYSSLGMVGVGKTHLVIAAARIGLGLYTPKNFDDPLLAVWDMPSYLNALKDSYEKGGTQTVQRSAASPAILVMDDLGAEYASKVGPGSWYAGLMYDILNARWKNQRATIVTTNLTIKELTARMDARCVSRLLALTGKPVEIKGQDYRLK